MKRINYLLIIFTVSLIFITGFIAFKSHVPNTWLTGWDTLHPEFDFPLNFSRVLNGVWREEQGLGAIAAHSHMSEVPRIVTLWLLSWVLPVNSVRYTFMAICFILGPIGIFFLTQELFKDKKHPYLISLGSFLAGLFYILNLGTVQHFYIVFEMFAVAYAFLPWLFLLALRYQRQGQRKDLWGLAVVGFLSSPMAYASTLWLVLMLGLGLFLIGLKSRWKRIISILLTLVAVNAYWLLPNLYFLKSEASKSVAEAKINQLFSPESFLQNKAYGNIADITLLKNFLFNWLIYDFQVKKYLPLLDIWQKQSQQFVVLGYGLMVVVGVGIGMSFGRKRSWWLALLMPTVMAVLFLVADNPPLGYVFAFLRDKVPLLQEALRTPFTKFSLLLMLTFSLYFGCGFIELIGLFKEKKARQIVGSIMVSGLMVGIAQILA